MTRHLTLAKCINIPAFLQVDHTLHSPEGMPPATWPHSAWFRMTRMITTTWAT